MRMKKFTGPAKAFLILLAITLVFYLGVAIKIAVAGKRIEHTTNVTINNHYSTLKRLSGRSNGVAAGLACGNLHFIPSRSLQAGAAVGNFNDKMGACVGGAFTTSKDGALVSGKIAHEEGEAGWSVGASWRFK